jgi:hypothetical protein
MRARIVGLTSHVARIPVVLVAVSLLLGCAEREPYAVICEAANRVATAGVATRMAAEARASDDLDAHGWYIDIADALLIEADDRLESVRNETVRDGSVWLAVRSATNTVTAVAASVAASTDVPDRDDKLASAQSDLATTEGVLGQICTGPSPIASPS